MKKRGYLEISFGWMFALVVGAAIIFLAIYGVTKLINTQQTTDTAKTSKEIGVLLNPLETGFETGKTTSFSLPAETRIYNKCERDGVFGRQLISASQKSFDKWTEIDIDVGFSNKYIFSDEYVEGTKFYVFSKPFEFPFKVADLIYITSSLKKYCFIDPPEKIKLEIESLNQENLLTEDCPEKSINVCFKGGSNCNVQVYYNSGYVEKSSGRMYFAGSDSLMYAAVFSSKDVYECQLNRLMKRLKSLALLYKDKSIFISNAGCNSNINQDLISLIDTIEFFYNSENLYLIKNEANQINKKNNENSRCKLW